MCSSCLASVADEVKGAGGVASRTWIIFYAPYCPHGLQKVHIVERQKSRLELLKKGTKFVDNLWWTQKFIVDLAVHFFYC